eukprot:GHVO01070293.1.p1 GENE.GHVO01070293.1~~GHVO01070293.1.p1  ORF type:complete len:207 (+),score=55.74 GHVO01070293.1:58-678(+)
MARVNNEGLNTQLMQRHAAKRVQETKYPKEEGDVAMAGLLDSYRTTVLNSCATGSTMSQILQCEGHWLSSDVDAQLILKVAFQEPVNVTRISLKANKRPPPPNVPAQTDDDPPQEDTEEEAVHSGPRTVLCYANLPDLDFLDVDQIREAQKLELTINDILEGTKFAMPGSAFQRCENIQIFIADNQKETPKTFLNELKVYGCLIAR